MATRIGQESNALEMLKNMIELDYDAVEAYEAAVEKLADTSCKEAFSAFKDDHERHVAELGAIVRQQGDTPPSKGDMKRLLTEGKVVLAALAGDKAILRAMKSNEDDTNAAYERATGRTDLPVGAGEVLAGGLADERRHREWIVSRMAQLEAAEAAAAQPGA